MKNGIGRHCQTISKIIIKHIFGGKAKSILTFLPLQQSQTSYGKIQWFS